MVWDISPSCISRAGGGGSPPRVIRRMKWSDLDFYGVRQGNAPSLREIAWDEKGSLFFVQEEHRWACGPHAGLRAPRVHLVWTTGIPIVPAPSAIGAAPTTTADDAGEEIVVQGPRWYDSCGATGNGTISFCTRCATTPTTDNPTLSSQPQASTTQTPPRPPSSPPTSSSSPPPPRRWPGQAPCWRHEDFPYLTVSEMHDRAAGVRIAARHCFMLEVLSVHIKPTLRCRVEWTGLGEAASINTTTTTNNNTSSSKTNARQSTSSSSSSSSGSTTPSTTPEPTSTNSASSPRTSPTSPRAEDRKSTPNTLRQIQRRGGVGGTATLPPTRPRPVPDTEEAAATRAREAVLARSQLNNNNNSTTSASDTSNTRRRTANSGGKEVEESHFSDELWTELLGRGYICGDERWVVGEDEAGDITVMRF